MGKNEYKTRLDSCNALAQVIIPLVLMSVVSTISLIYLVAMVCFQVEFPSPIARFLILGSIILIAAVGFLMLLNFMKNITMLRQHVANVAAAVLPEKINCLDSHIQEDFIFIEQALDILVEEIDHLNRIGEQQMRAAHELRERAR